MSKKIGIITILDRNYGNRLQNYALQTVVKKLGYEVNTIDIKQRTKSACIKTILKSFLIKCKYKKQQPFWIWEVFDYKYIKKDYIDALDLKEGTTRYDKIIVGSDQVWNPILYYFEPDIMFLKFASSMQKVAYAASIGISELPEEWILEFETGLCDFTAISMREADGANVIENILKRNIPVVLDPTMLITKDEWAEFAKKSNVKRDKKYVLKYYLGQKTDNVDVVISQYAENNDFEIVDINKKEKNIGPIEFLWLIKNCEMMFTDSFHGSIFSIIFNKKFWIFERPAQSDTGEMNSRLHTLATHFNINKRILISNELRKDFDFEEEIDYRSIDFILKRKREQSYDYLKSILEKK